MQIICALLVAGVALGFQDPEDTLVTLEQLGEGTGGVSALLSKGSFEMKMPSEELGEQDGSGCYKPNAHPSLKVSWQVPRLRGLA